MDRYADLDSRFLRFQRRLAASPERVWSALVDPDQLALWLAPATIELHVGGAVILRFGHAGDAEMHGIIRRLEPPTLLEYTWRESGKQSVVRWEIETAGAGETHLTFTQSIETEADPAGLAAGWHVHLNLLDASFAGRPFHWDDRLYETLRTEYSRRTQSLDELGRS